MFFVEGMASNFHSNIRNQKPFFFEAGCLTKTVGQPKVLQNFATYVAKAPQLSGKSWHDLHDDP